MPAPLGFSRWFSAFFLRHKPRAEQHLTFPNFREKHLDVKVALRRDFLARSMDFRHDRVFPHNAMFP